MPAAIYCMERYCPRQPQVEVFFRLEATQTESLESTPAETRRS